MTNIDISENTFSRKLSSSYELSILQRVDSFAFMLVDEQRQIQLLRRYPLDGSTPVLTNLENLYLRDELLRLPFRKVQIGVVTERQTLIPNRLFNPQEKATYLQQLTSVPEGMNIKSDDLDGFAAQNVYALPADQAAFYHRHHGAGRLCHAGSPFLLTLRSMVARQEGPFVSVHVWPRQFQLIFFLGRELQLINYYTYFTAKDFLYFTLLVFDQFNLDPAEVPLMLSGEILEDSEIFRHLSRYVRQVKIADAPGFIQLGPSFESLPPHLFFDLFCLAVS